MVQKTCNIQDIKTDSWGSHPVGILFVAKVSLLKCYDGTAQEISYGCQLLSGSVCQNL
jgi:hypothetical protein